MWDIESVTKYCVMAGRSVEVGVSNSMRFADDRCRNKRRKPRHHRRLLNIAPKTHDDKLLLACDKLI